VRKIAFACARTIAWKYYFRKRGSFVFQYISRCYFDNSSLYATIVDRPHALRTKIIIFNDFLKFELIYTLPFACFSKTPEDDNKNTNEKKASCPIESWRRHLQGCDPPTNIRYTLNLLPSGLSNTFFLRNVFV